MKKAHRLMIPLLVVISISALLGASVIAEKPEHREHPLLEGVTCHCFLEPGDDGYPGCDKSFDPLCCHGCTGWCLGAHISDNNGKGGAMHRFTNPSNPEE
jgi:hypothetical protein